MDSSRSTAGPYRGRLAPSPTGHLHVGHARTFWTAWSRAQQARGTLIMRNEDLDPDRSKPEFAAAMLEDLRWLGLSWSEGPDVGGPFGPYEQSARRAFYADALRTLADQNLIYPCTCSRRELAQAAQAPNQGDEELIYPGTCRSKNVPDAREWLEQIIQKPTLTPALSHRMGEGESFDRPE